MLAQFSDVEPAHLRAALLGGEDLKLAASLLYQSYHDDPLFMAIFRANATD